LAEVRLALEEKRNPFLEAARVLLRALMERGRIVDGADGGRVSVEFQFEGRRVVLDIGSSGINPLSSPLLKNFNCPSSRSAA
jgi:type VI protein secretion system component VasK